MKTTFTVIAIITFLVSCTAKKSLIEQTIDIYTKSLIDSAASIDEVKILRLDTLTPKRQLQNSINELFDKKEIAKKEMLDNAVVLNEMIKKYDALGTDIPPSVGNPKIEEAARLKFIFDSLNTDLTKLKGIRPYADSINYNGFLVITKIKYTTKDKVQKTMDSVKVFVNKEFKVIEKKDLDKMIIQ